MSRLITKLFVGLGLLALVQASDASERSASVGLNAVSFGPLQVGMTQKSLEDWSGAKPGGCATCRKGELYLQLDKVRAQGVIAELASLSLLEDTGGGVVEVFIFKGQVETIRIGGLVSRAGEQALSKRFGPGQMIQQDKDIMSIEWKVGRQRVLFTSGFGGTDLIVQRDVPKRIP